MTKKEKAIVAVIVLIAAVSIYDAVTSYLDCDRAGGTPVRGLLGIECIK